MYNATLATAARITIACSKTAPAVVVNTAIPGDTVMMNTNC